MKKNSFLTVCMNPTLQKTLSFPMLIKDSVNRTGEYRLDASGKGINVSRVLTQLGRDCCHLTQLGGIMRPLFMDLCRKDKLRLEWVESGSPIRFCYTLLDANEKSVTELVEESERVGEGTEGRLLDAFSALIGEFSTLIISGTKADGFSDALVPEMVKKARREGCRVILDVRGNDLLNSLPHGPLVIKPNLYEFFLTFAPEFISNNGITGNEGQIRERAEQIWAGLREKYSLSLVLTRGHEPVWYGESGDLLEHALSPVPPLNTTGSGDAFTAGLASALEDGAPLSAAIASGARCGALNAGLLRPGVIR